MILTPLVLALLPALAPPAEDRPVGAATQSITAADIQAHVDFLASDLLEGRDSGYRGAETAALYIAAQFASFGLEPLLDDWQQPVPLRNARGDGAAVLTVGAHREAAADQVQVRDFAAPGHVRAVAADEESIAPGVIAVVPGGDDERADQDRAIELSGRGAAAVVFVTDHESLPEARSRDRRRRGSGGGATFEAMRAAEVSVPVVRVSSPLGRDLLDAAAQGALVSIGVDFAGKDETTNVLARLEGSDPVLAHEVVVIGSHYDHVGTDGEGNIWNGADDNASGTSGMLEIAEALATVGPRPRRTIVFCAWGAEERGLVGSKRFAEMAPVPFERIAAYINLDMISRNAPNSVDVVHSSDQLFEMMKVAGAAHGLEVKEGMAFYLNASDTQAFVEQEIPCVFPFTGTHEDYHRPSDDPDKIDAAKAERVARSAFDVLVRVANMDERPRYDAQSMMRRGGAGRSGRRLGIRPGDSAGESGILVSATIPGSAAHGAGVREDDLIVRIGATPIEGLRDLRRALTADGTEDGFEIEVVRDDEHVVLNAKFD